MELTIDEISEHNILQLRAESKTGLTEVESILLSKLHEKIWEVRNSEKYINWSQEDFINKFKIIHHNRVIRDINAVGQSNSKPK